MSYTNISNRDLLKKAMPLNSFSKEQWEIFLNHLETIEALEDDDSKLVEMLHVVFENQARISVMENYCFYFNDSLDKDMLNNA